MRYRDVGRELFQGWARSNGKDLYGLDGGAFWRSELGLEPFGGDRRIWMKTRFLRPMPKNSNAGWLPALLMILKPSENALTKPFTN